MVRESDRPGPATIQAVERAFEILEAFADLGGTAGVTTLTANSTLPLATTHRILRTLVDLGYVRQVPSRQYALSPRFLRLGDVASQLLGHWVKPILSELVDATGETANLAILDSDRAMYVAQSPSPHSMRMFTEVGRRVGLHCTGVGKAMLAQLPRERVDGIVERLGLPRMTSETIIDREGLEKELALVRSRGYALDEGEQEVGVRCVAAALPGVIPLAAVSISGPLGRISNQGLVEMVPHVLEASARLSAELLGTPESGGSSRSALSEPS